MVAALRQLPHMERWVVSHRYYDDQTLDDLARASGLSRERIRQLELRGLALLRDLLENWRDAEAVGRVGGKVLPEVNTRPTSLLQALPDDLADQVRQVCRNDEALIDSLLDAGLDTITPSRVEALSIKYRHGAHKDRQRTMADTHGAPAHLVKSGLETLVSNLRHMLKGDFSEVDLGKARGRVRSPTALLIECGVRIAIPGSRETRQKQALAAVMRSELSKREKGLIILAYGLTGDPQPQNLFGITRMLEKLRDAFGTS